MESNTRPSVSMTTAVFPPAGGESDWIILDLIDISALLYIATTPAQHTGGSGRELHTEE